MDEYFGSSRSAIQCELIILYVRLIVVQINVIQ